LFEGLWDILTSEVFKRLYKEDMTIEDRRNHGMYNFFALGIKWHTIFIHPFAAYKFDKEEADRILNFMERKHLYKRLRKDENYFSI
jgi:hypothetical protein